MSLKYSYNFLRIYCHSNRDFLQSSLTGTVVLMSLAQGSQLPCCLLAIGEVHEHVGAAGVVNQGVAEEQRACPVDLPKHGIIVEN